MYGNKFMFLGDTVGRVRTVGAVVIVSLYEVLKIKLGLFLGPGVNVSCLKRVVPLAVVGRVVLVCFWLLVEVIGYCCQLRLHWDSFCFERSLELALN